MTEPTSDFRSDVVAFYSDPHFGHANILGYANRPYANTHEMGEEFIQLYNSVIEPGQLVVWLGDCFFYGEQEFQETLKRMNGRKILVRGNHDRLTSKKFRELGFEQVLGEVLMTIDGVPVRCNHYPYQRPGEKLTHRQLKRRPLRVSGEVLLHGHTHSQCRQYDNCIHVGVDAWGYRPATVTEIADLIRG